MKYHIRNNGEPGVCKAEINCPLGQIIDDHFTTKESARDHFEKIMQSSEQDLSLDDKKLLEDYSWSLLEIIPTISESGNEIIIGGKSLSEMSETRLQEVARGNSKEIAETVAYYTEGEDDYDDGLVEMTIISHRPLGSEFTETHFANIFERNGQKYVFDAAYAEINPNAKYPYISTYENWKNSIDKVSFIGVEEKEPEPIDPRTLELPKVSPGDFNPLIEKSVMSEIYQGSNNDLVRFLVIDEVKVAAVKYNLKDNKPSLCSIETRHEYKNQGYMKKLLKDLSKEYNVDRPLSSGSMTKHGYEFTRHLTEAPQEGQRINFPEFTDEKPFTFIDDWVEGRFA